MLILHDLEPIHWAWAGLGIALITLLLQYVGNVSLGISTGFEDLCGLITRQRFFQRGAVVTGRRWRYPFMAGLVAAGAVSAIAGGGWAPIWDLGMFDARIGGGPGVKLAWMFAGGVLIGFGTRLAGGCTSGHGVFGLATMQLASLRSVLAFMATGIVVANLIYRVIW